MAPRTKKKTSTRKSLSPLAGAPRPEWIGSLPDLVEDTREVPLMAPVTLADGAAAVWRALVSAHDALSPHRGIEGVADTQVVLRTLAASFVKERPDSRAVTFAKELRVKLAAVAAEHPKNTLEKRRSKVEHAKLAAAAFDRYLDEAEGDAREASSYLEYLLGRLHNSEIADFMRKLSPEQIAAGRERIEKRLVQEKFVVGEQAIRIAVVAFRWPGRPDNLFRS